MILKIRQLAVIGELWVTAARVFTELFSQVKKTGLWRYESWLKAHMVMILLFLIGFTIKSNTALANNESIRFSENANLAIRRTAHLLLTSNGDSTTTIPPVQQTEANTFTIELSHVFKYEELPELLQKSFDQYGIKRGYQVALLDCDSGAVQLGYSFLDLQQPEGVPCSTRAEKEGCHILKVVFEPEKQVAKTTSGWWILPVGSIVLLAGFMFWRRSRKEDIVGREIDIPISGQNSKLLFGNSQLDASNLTLTCFDAVHNLTYREAKLLKLFVAHPNQILERDKILKSVWEDEGVIVGRSVDVFVSRLRKMLSEDPAIKIAAVHGVGYRMEVV